MYEVELKIETSSPERALFVSKLNEMGFKEAGSVTQNDNYIEAKKSPYGGYDLKRYRDESGTCIYTEKTWELVEGNPIRKEDEHEVSKGIFDTEIEKSAFLLKIQKDRISFKGLYKEQNIKIDLDTIKFDHSPDLRYFVEAEILVANKEEVKATQEFLKEFLKKALGREEILQSPGMFTMAFEKR